MLTFSDSAIRHIDWLREEYKKESPNDLPETLWVGKIAAFDDNLSLLRSGVAVGFFLVSEMNDAIRESTVISEGLPYVVLGTPAIKLELSSGVSTTPRTRHFS